MYVAFIQCAHTDHPFTRKKSNIKWGVQWFVYPGFEGDAKSIVRKNLSPAAQIDGHAH